MGVIATEVAWRRARKDCTIIVLHTAMACMPGGVKLMEMGRWIVAMCHRLAWSFLMERGGAKLRIIRWVASRRTGR